MISVDDYNRFKMLDDREALLAEDLPEDLIADLDSKLGIQKRGKRR